MKVIVTGSLGHVGRPLTQALVQQGDAATVITSKQDKIREIEALGAQAAVGSLEDVEFLTGVFTGADAVFAMIPPNFTEPDPRAYYRRLGNNYAAAIKASGTGRVVALSSWGAHLPAGTGFILGSHDVEGILDAVPGATVTHLRAGYFYYNLYSFVDMIKCQGVMGSNYGGADKLVMVAPADIAMAALDELTATDNRAHIRYVASDERTAAEVAQILGAAIGKPDLQWILFSNEQLQATLEQHGLPPHIAASSVDLGASIHSGAMGEDYQLHKPGVMGTVKIEDFAKEFAAAFR